MKLLKFDVVAAEVIVLLRLQLGIVSLGSVVCSVPAPWLPGVQEYLNDTPSVLECQQERGWLCFRGEGPEFQCGEGDSSTDRLKVPLEAATTALVPLFLIQGTAAEAAEHSPGSKRLLLPPVCGHLVLFLASCFCFSCFELWGCFCC